MSTTRTDTVPQSAPTLRRAAGTVYFPIAFIARFPFAMMVVGTLTLVVAARESVALGGLNAAVLGLGSALVGRPLVGAIYAAVEGMGSAWRQDARLRRVFALASVFWALVFASRAVVQGTLYVLDRPGLLAAARLLMGWPLTIAAVAFLIATA